MMSLRNGMIVVVIIFTMLSLFMFVQHEIVLMQKTQAVSGTTNLRPVNSKIVERTREIVTKGRASSKINFIHEDVKEVEAGDDIENDELKDLTGEEKKEKGINIDFEPITEENVEIDKNPEKLHNHLPVEPIKEEKPHKNDENPRKKEEVLTEEENEKIENKELIAALDEKMEMKELELNNAELKDEDNRQERRGLLTCNGQLVDSEVIYWKIVPGDDVYESPITPHHDNHHDRYVTFEYDQGGWNNVRMSLECVIVVAHAMGRTLVVPPQQHLYLLMNNHKDKHDEKAHDEMGFEDFFDMDLLRSHKGFHVIHMEEFLAKEGVTGGLHGILPPDNSTEAWGGKLWAYLDKVADLTPSWQGRVMAFPDRPGNFNFSEKFKNETVRERLKRFVGDRRATFYDAEMQKAHHIHIPGDGKHRVLQHHYAFAFFADPAMQSFYKRFVRDYMRYKDEIQCAGSRLLAAVRADALKHDPSGGGKFYAIHARRGDFQFKNVKISANDMVKNLKHPNGTSLIPTGSILYLSTDDPDGVCKNCFVNRKPCTSYPKDKQPEGCPVPTNWDAFKEAGWEVRMLRDYLKTDLLKDVNPNTFGMVESIVCSRAEVFAGTFFSTFTGYIHRLRGYHGLGEQSYYHHKNYVHQLRMKNSIGHGFSREWRAGWTDDGGELI